MPDVITHPYKRGDGALIPVAEADPFGFWLAEMESTGKGLTSYYCDGLLIAITGYQLQWRGVAYAFALINRDLAAGSGRELAAAVRQRIAELMRSDNLHRVQASANANDRAAAVFLRATGYRLESRMIAAAPDGSDLFLYTIIKGRKHEQED